MRSAPIIITIDGPAASGKTTVSRTLAVRHGWAWVSTGAFYRGLACIAARLGVSQEDEETLSKLCLSDVWSVKMTAELTKVFLGDEEVTNEIYKEDNGTAASFISRYPTVRKNLLEAQRRCALGVNGLIAEGRDCGTVVFPDARVKLYITAGSDSRAERRAKEQGSNVEVTRMAQTIRDKQDASRKTAPMQIPENAFVVDTSDMTLAEVIESIDKIVTKELEPKP
jgi:cytidylate kinase